MGDGMEVDDAREELALPVGFAGPTGNLLKDLRVASLRIIEARSVDKCDFCTCILKRVRLDLAGTFFLLTFKPNYSRGLSYKYKDHHSLRPPGYQ